MRFLVSPRNVAAVLAPFLALAGLRSLAQQEEHRRNYKPLPPTVRVQVTVLKSFNGKPFANAGVIFHAVRNGKNDGNLEVKTDPEGRANIDVIEMGSHVTLQVIARGYSTFATEFEADSEEKTFTVKLERPRAQVSVYEDNEGKAAQVKPGIQERHIAKPTVTPASPTTPLQRTPVANTPVGTPDAGTNTGKPQ